MDIIYCLTSYWKDAADERTGSYALAKIDINCLLPFLIIEYFVFKYFRENYTRNIRENHYQALKLIIYSLFAVLNLMCTIIIVKNFSLLSLISQLYFKLDNPSPVTTDPIEDKLSTSEYFAPSHFFIILKAKIFVGCG